ncbi:hypothetical protein STREPTOSP366_35230 [Streptomyces variabilis]
MLERARGARAAPVRDQRRDQPVPEDHAEHGEGTQGVDGAVAVGGCGRVDAGGGVA